MADDDLGPFEVAAEAAHTADSPAGLFDGRVVWRRGAVQVREADDVYAVIVHDGTSWYSPGPLDNLMDGFVGTGACDDVGLTGAAAKPSGGILWITVSFRCRRHGHAKYAIVYACQGGEHPECARIQAGDADEGGTARIEGDHAVVRWGKVQRPVTVTF